MSTVINQFRDIGPGRVEEMVPGMHRLRRKANGELVLQGCYRWSRGTEFGAEWRDLPTVEEPREQDMTQDTIAILRQELAAAHKRLAGLEAAYLEQVDLTISLRDRLNAESA